MPWAIPVADVRGTPDFALAPVWSSRGARTHVDSPKHASVATNETHGKITKRRDGCSPSAALVDVAGLFGGFPAGFIALDVEDEVVVGEFHRWVEVFVE